MTPTPSTPRTASALSGAVSARALSTPSLSAASGAVREALACSKRQAASCTYSVSLGLEGDEPLPLLERRLERARLQRGAIPPEGLRPAGGGGESPIGETEFRGRRLGRAPAAFHFIFIELSLRCYETNANSFPLYSGGLRSPGKTRTLKCSCCCSNRSAGSGRGSARSSGKRRTCCSEQVDAGPIPR